MNPSASIVIPTHNRKESLLRAIRALQLQTYSPEDMEVIVVSDGPSNGTAEALASVKAAFPITFKEQEKSGAAAARNTGAQLAVGSILIFLDDDIEAASRLVEAHVKGHVGSGRRVVIGYLPPVIYCKNVFLQPRLREWWETFFHAMRRKSHRFSYRNLTSGNFSISKALFDEVGGFNTQFKCQEDYELGLRLILNGAEFHFEDAAMGYHHEMTDLKKAAERKLQEGAASVLFAKKYPELIPTLPLSKRLRKKMRRREKILLNGMFRSTNLIKAYTLYLNARLRFSERLRLRQLWQKTHSRLLDLHFLKGVATASNNLKELQSLFSAVPKADTQVAARSLVIDLKKGITEAERTLDSERPSKVDLYFGNQKVGSMVQSYGFEPFRGAHLRPALSREFSHELLKAIAFEEVLKGDGVVAEPLSPIKENESTYGYSGV